MAKVKKMAAGGLGAIPMPAMPSKVVSNLAPAAKPVVAPAPAPKPVVAAPKPVVAPPKPVVAPPPPPKMSPIQMMMARMRGMRFQDGGKVSTAKKNKSAPNW